MVESTTIMEDYRGKKNIQVEPMIVKPMMGSAGKGRSQ